MAKHEVSTPEQLDVAISANALRKRAALALSALAELLKGLEQECSSSRAR